MTRTISGAMAADRRGSLPSLQSHIAVLLSASTAAVAVAWVFLTVLDDRLASAVLALAAVGFGVIGAVLVVKRQALSIGWILTVAGLSMALEGGSLEYAHRALEVSGTGLPAGEFAAWLGGWCPLITNGLLLAVLPQLYPNGKLVSARWRFTLWAGLAFVILATVGNAMIPQRIEGLSNQSNPYAVAALTPFFKACIYLSLPALVLGVAGGGASLVIRWRRTRGDERQQINWFVAATIPAAFSALVVHSIDADAGDICLAVTLPLIPLGLGVAILRYRLYDLKLFVNRALVYALLSGLVIAIYLAVVTGIEWVVGGSRSLQEQALATLIAAAAFQPMRSRAQRLVDRLFYGETARPYEALARLGERLELAPVPETVLTTIVRTVADVLQLPGAAIEFRADPGWALAATHGTVTAEAAAFPMVYQGEVIGRLLAERRASGEGFRPLDVRLLTDLARQAGVAAHAVRVTADLQRSRTAVVAAREEERRRLRRDLHDGLGPALAGITLGLHAARSTLRRDLGTSEDLLVTLESQMEEAVQDIRRLVYGLRPPALDEVGLVRALQQQATRLEGPDGFMVSVHATPPDLPQLPAAVEVAAYRIAMEAMTNAARHGRAGVCTVQITLDRCLDLEIADDGIGLASDAEPGVGLNSMRERASELGGAFDVESSDAGTIVRATLPVVSGHG